MSFEACCESHRLLGHQQGGLAAGSVAVRPHPGPRPRRPHPVVGHGGVPVEAGVQDLVSDREKTCCAAVKVVAMDGFTGSKNAAVEELTEAVTVVMEPLPVFRLAGKKYGSVPPPNHQQTQDHRGHAGDPLYSTRCRGWRPVGPTAADHCRGRRAVVHGGPLSASAPTGAERAARRLPAHSFASSRAPWLPRPDPGSPTGWPRPAVGPG